MHDLIHFVLLQGLGNAFLANISACDAIFHVVSKIILVCSAQPTDFLFISSLSLSHIGAFEDEDVTHVEGDINPVRDLEIISEELRLKDIDYLSKRVVCFVFINSFSYSNPALPRNSNFPFSVVVL